MERLLSGPMCPEKATTHPDRGGLLGYREQVSRLLEAEAFIRVIDLRSFTAAAKELGRSTSYVSRLVTRLEERLGVRLVVRTTRKVEATAAGAAYYDRCTELVRGLDAAEDVAREFGESLRGVLRVTAPTGWASVLAEALVGFRQLHPLLSLELTLVDRQVHLVDEGFDVALRAGELMDDSLIALKLTDTYRAVLASPEYVARRGMPASPDALREHECLLYAHHRDPHVWRLQGPSGTTAAHVKGTLMCNHGGLLVEAATLGQGLALVPEIHARAALASGRLVRVLPEWSWPLTLFAVYPPAPRVPRRVRAFIDFLADHVRDTRAGAGHSLSSS